ncbi:MAG: hypothetical protein UU05_C0001G0039 [Candidatus Curtissbacteria bacterium GW2011_GWA1_40_47]|uniref:Membrane protein 6-pyruvoyl-tetrahydropterin synthase-related domain-containing protein n=1 Tax=Candidatus Curtissbacteria bacterium RIFOXYA1_FULL_41_14 TaxID=1797737 RepID=A0A1F5HAS2_9BACT|nr:MAG: hypothetical protein UT95_C0001G0098 [Candidatus Curtissbacteria bacterium GW2011_GWB1_40_28]KKR62384.1 MAG: hypothetical protein UU00_C0001G0104 [Microgenomates group bacterium GW2011_GWC1_40_35]KKR66415.1 MAG: hypothetical protein UU05_C0001G0039 [Candidatus Curtissbacteria bacterium GW2011_GWA1_40_47]KKR77663.1 MAG: hypothetical protein UU19_C0006G0008 [Candidatus Curtissbacteria bacterium GW2011_GWD1_40_8]KKS02552.1 MAG: hypothetical protein UU53_C0001G0097 [Candidatus Curtissbacter
MFYTSDLITQYLPWYYLISGYLKNLQIPHWVPLLYQNGYPLLAEGETGILSPINSLILFIFPFSVSVNLLYLSYAIIAIAGTYFFLQENNCSKLGSLLGGLIFILSGFIVSRYFQPSIIFTASLMPWGFLIIQKSSKNTNSLFLLPFLIYLQITAGHVQIALTSIAGYLSYVFILSILKKQNFFQVTKKILMVIFFTILGLGLSAIQLLPTARLFTISQRQDWGIAIHFSYSLPESHLITYLLPGVFGVSRPGDDLGFTQIGGGFWELNITIWTAPFLLALLPIVIIFKNRNIKTVGALYIIWAIFLLISFGGYFKPYWIVAHIPDFPFRAPARFALVSTFAAASLAAFGYELITKRLNNYFKVILFTAIITSVIIQQILVFNKYFIWENSQIVLEGLENLSEKQLTTPLKLNMSKTDGSPELIFKREFQKGAIISILTLSILYLWWLFMQGMRVNLVKRRKKN